MGNDGHTVILEGRAQTVNYVETKHRFELTMSDPSLIGKRRAAQRIGAMAIDECSAGADDAAVMASVKSALAKLHTTIEQSQATAAAPAAAPAGASGRTPKEAAQIRRQWQMPGPTPKEAAQIRRQWQMQ